jgi:hypothetical protein
MRLKLILMILFLPSIALTKMDSWFCTEQSMRRHGDSVDACGTGMSGVKSVAMDEAFRRARRTFDMICRSSDTCHGYPVSIDPGRITCDVVKQDFGTGEYWTCIQMVTFTVDKHGHRDIYAY